MLSHFTETIKIPWILCDNDYDEIWDIIFEEEGIIAEEEISYDPEIDGEVGSFKWLM